MSPLAGPPTLLKSSTTVWVVLSLLVHVTMPPFATVIWDGVNIIFFISTLPVADGWLEFETVEFVFEGFWVELLVGGGLLFVELLFKASAPPIINTAKTIIAIKPDLRIN
jgi:hypothetical protein